MKQLLFLFMLLPAGMHAQDITGLWNSQDGTRVYEIKQTAAHTFTAVIRSSTRNADSIGYAVIRELQYNPRKKRYEGVIYAVSDNEPRFVRMRFAKNPDRVVLKLSRMFIFGVSINWTRVVSKSA